MSAPDVPAGLPEALFKWAALAVFYAFSAAIVVCLLAGCVLVVDATWRTLRSSAAKEGRR